MELFLSLIDKAKLEPTEQLPQTFSIVLEPKNESAFCKIQKLAQNPYVCIDVQATQTVKFLIAYLENKWKDRRTQFVSILKKKMSKAGYLQEQFRQNYYKLA